jgi:hypothetical protein
MMLADARVSLPWLVLAVCTALLASVGCGAIYRPMSPRVARADAFELSLESLELDSDYFGTRSAVLRVRVRRVPEHSKLLHFVLADARRPRCEGGLSALELDIAGQRWAQSRDALRAGDELVAHFDAALWDGIQKAPSRADVVVTDELGMRTCITFPLVDAAPENRWSDPGSISLGVGMAGQGFVGTLGNIDGTITLPMMVGRWFGPVRLSLTFAPGVAQCPHGQCPSSENKVNNAPYLPLSIGAEVGHSAGLLRIGLKAGYSAGPARVDARVGGSYWELVHGPVLTPRLGISLPDPLAPGLAGGERLGSFIGVEVPISYVLDGRGHQALGIGGTLSWVFAL